MRNIWFGTVYLGVTLTAPNLYQLDIKLCHSSKGGLNSPILRAPPPFQFRTPFLNILGIPPYWWTTPFSTKTSLPIPFLNFINSTDVENYQLFSHPQFNWRWELPTIFSLHCIQENSPITKKGLWIHNLHQEISLGLAGTRWVKIINSVNLGNLIIFW